MARSFPNPLRELHEHPEAEFQPYAELEIVSTFGEPEAEYAAIRKGCALVDLPQRGILQLTGKDRLPFLNNVLTNQTWDKNTKSGMPAGKGVYAYFLNTKGRIVADMNVLERGDHTLIETDVRMVESLRTAWEKFLFTEQVKMSPRVGELHQIALHGPGALTVLREASGESIAELGPLESTQVRLLGGDAVVWRDDPTGAPGYHLLIDASAAPAAWGQLLRQFEGVPGRRPLRPAGWAAFNATRIEAGRPLFDIDFGNSANPDLSVLPAEAGDMNRAVSFTKGCYLGQEIVARMHARGQVARQLSGIRFPDDTLPVAGAPIFESGDSATGIGMVTSSTVSPLLSGAAICLGYLKKPFFTIGTTVGIPAEGSIRSGTVTRLPFVELPTAL